jgi:hypothetical protein
LHNNNNYRTGAHRTGRIKNKTGVAQQQQQYKKNKKQNDDDDNNKKKNNTGSTGEAPVNACVLEEALHRGRTIT